MCRAISIEHTRNFRFYIHDCLADTGWVERLPNTTSNLSIDHCGIYNFLEESIGKLGGQDAGRYVGHSLYETLWKLARDLKSRC